LKANSNKQYLEWEKELRVNSIMMITGLFKDNISLGVNHNANSNNNDRSAYTIDTSHTSPNSFFPNSSTLSTSSTVSNLHPTNSTRSLSQNLSTPPQSYLPSTTILSLPSS
jgi:hypothetical protein